MAHTGLIHFGEHFFHQEPEHEHIHRLITISFGHKGINRRYIVRSKQIEILVEFAVKHLVMQITAVLENNLVKAVLARPYAGVLSGGRLHLIKQIGSDFATERAFVFLCGFGTALVQFIFSGENLFGCCFGGRVLQLFKFLASGGDVEIAFIFEGVGDACRSAVHLPGVEVEQQQRIAFT